MGNLPIFLIPIIVGLVTQGIKALVDYSQRRFQWGLPSYGGMPSAHTSFAFSIATLVAIHEGLNSVLFVIAVAIVIFIVDDALRLRVFLGNHGLALNKLLSKLPQDEAQNIPQIEERLGHKWLEVIVGAALGIILTLILDWLI